MYIYRYKNDSTMNYKTRLKKLKALYNKLEWVYFRVKKHTSRSLSMPRTVPDTQAHNAFLLNKYGTEVSRGKKRKEKNKGT